MSRTRKGSKPMGYDYWSKRPYSKNGYGKDVKDMTHRKERAMSKEELYKENVENDSTNDHPYIVNYFIKQGINIEIQAQHPCSLDVIFDIKTGKWLGYVSDFCFIHNDMYCEICLDGILYE